MTDYQHFVHAFMVHDGHATPPYDISMFEEKITCPHCRETKGLKPSQGELSVFEAENENSKSVLELSHDEARKFFLKQESYCNFDLPEYFKFESLLSSIDCALNGKNLSDYRRPKPSDSKAHPARPRDLDDINYKILNNKDGKYAWRPLQLINPTLYVSLVHKITTQDNWRNIRNRFKKFSEGRSIECISIPRQSLTKNSDKAEDISNWWHQIEQRSIELALDYPCLTHTDITDCYGAIYTHSVAWAIHGKTAAKNKRNDNNLIGNQIDAHLQDMSHGQTNGIPQGSTLMDFIAEMVLGYADLELNERLRCEGITKYTILRYRDDYRIFSHSQNNNDRIIKCLTEVMISLGMKLSAEKTSSSAHVIKGSIKSDKVFWIKQKQEEKNLQKHLLIIHDMSMRFPNCGSLSVALKSFYKKLGKRKKINEGIVPLISILTDIAHKNPRTYQYVAANISLLLQFESNASKKDALLEKIINKFNDIPNTGHLDIWIQRVSLGVKSSMTFEEPLCKVVEGQNLPIWNVSWLQNSLIKQLDFSSIVDKDAILKLPEVITKKEVSLFRNEFNSEI